MSDQNTEEELEDEELIAEIEAEESEPVTAFRFWAFAIPACGLVSMTKYGTLGAAWDATTGTEAKYWVPIGFVVGFLVFWLISKMTGIGRKGFSFYGGIFSAFSAFATVLAGLSQIYFEQISSDLSRHTERPISEIDIDHYHIAYALKKGSLQIWEYQSVGKVYFGDEQSPKCRSYRLSYHQAYGFASNDWGTC